MTNAINDPVLLVGGSGIIGSQAAQALRKLQPGLPLAIGGRDQIRARTAADELGNARGVSLDLGRPDLGLSEDDRFSAVAVFLKDDTLNTMKFAQARNIPYVTVAMQSHELGPELALLARKVETTTLVNLSAWLAGTLLTAAIHFSKDFKKIHAVRACMTMDEENFGGPIAQWEMDRFVAANPQPQILKDGHWIFPKDGDLMRDVTSVDGIPMAVMAMPMLDAFSLAAAIDAPNVRFDAFTGESAGRRLSGALSTDYFVEFDGIRKDGATGEFRYNIIQRGGQTVLTGLGSALAIERLLGLAGGERLGPGYHNLESIIDTAYLVQRMKEAGTEFSQDFFTA